MEKCQKFTENINFHLFIEYILSIQDRFQSEHVYMQKGKGFLKSAGVGDWLDKKKKSRKNKFLMRRTEPWLVLKDGRGLQ